MEFKRNLGICPRCKNPNSPIVAPDTQTEGSVCDKCFEEILQVSGVITCKKCGSFAGAMAAGDYEGFIVSPGDNLHVDECMQCPIVKPGLEFKIVEMEEYFAQKDGEANE